MLRIFVLLIAFFGTVLKLYGQDSLPLAKDFPVTVYSQIYNLSFDIAGSQIKHRYKNIIIVDSRPDTSRIGLYRFGNKPYTREIRLKNSMSSRLVQLFSSQLISENAEEQLLINLKECWISHYTNKIPPKNEENYRSGINMMIQLRADLFKKSRDGWSPCSRIDTVLYSPGTVVEWGERKLNDLMRDFTVQIALQKNFKNNSKEYSLDSLQRYFSAEYEFPIYQISELKKGAYRNIHEFQNNSPSLKDYRIKQEKNYFEVYKGDSLIDWHQSKSIWGISDGIHIYVKSAEKFFPIIRQGKSLYIYGDINPEKRSFYKPINLLQFPYLSERLNDPSTIEIPKQSLNGFALYRIDVRNGFIY